MTQADVNSLVTRNMGLIYHIARQHGPIGRAYDTDDVAQAMFAEALRVFHRYDSTRMPEGHFIGMVMWRFLAKERRRYKEDFNEITVDTDMEDTTPVSTVPFFQALFEELCNGLAAAREDLARVLEVLLGCDGDYRAAARVLGCAPRSVRRRVAEIRETPIGTAVAAVL